MSQPSTVRQTTAATSTVAGLGRLTELGLTDPWQVALVLPQSFEDFGNVQDDAHGFDDGRTVAIEGRIRMAPKETKGKVWRIWVPLQLADGTVVNVTFFGDPREYRGRFKPGHFLIVKGALSLFGGGWSMASPTIIDAKWRGRARPNYAGMGKRMNGDTMRERVVPLLRAELQRAAAECVNLLGGAATEQEILAAIGAPAGVDVFERLLVRAHCPKDPETGRAAVTAMEHFAALVTIKSLMDTHEREAKSRAPIALNLPVRLAQWQVTPSASQKTAVGKMQALFSGERVSSMLLSGDVGSGKTLVYLTLAAGVVDGGGRVAILLPNEGLARQVQADLAHTFPDIASVLVTGDTKATGSEAAVAIGTTALLSRPAGEFDLLVCDEQQKLGADQRRALRTGNAHMLEVTATAIPRTLALAAFGMIETMHLRAGHAAKDIATRIWEKGETRGLFVEVRETIRQGGRVLVVYPAIGKSTGAKALRSIEDAVEKWEKMFPGLIRVLNSKVKGPEKIANLQDLKDGTARIGICTSVIEVGLNIPNMRRVVVVHPERFGLTTLHQIRGRLAREGGHGDFDMLLMDEASEDTMTRLQVMVDTNDGYELAEADLRLRGPGELKASGTRQSGGAMSILYGREIVPEHLAAMEPTVKRWAARQATTPMKEVAA